MYLSTNIIIKSKYMKHIFFLVFQIIFAESKELERARKNGLTIRAPPKIDISDTFYGQDLK